MAADTSWYAVVESTGLEPSAVLEQGDILLECPRFAVAGLGGWPVAEDADPEVEVEVVDAVVLTQTCDLVQEKVEWVLLGVVVDWASARDHMVATGNEKAKSKRSREALVQGNLPAMALLRKHEASPELPWSVVDFHQVFTLPKRLVLEVAAAAGPRLRMLPPYKEHLAQAFARYFTRVGLPLDAREFIKDGAA